ncbi:MAG: UDP-N-acetylmuramyl-tripeptide synthetase, partial [Acidimicrobiales bacterium]
FHETIEAYFAAKARLFSPERARFAVVNRDDEFGRRLLDRAEIPTVSYSLGDARDLELNLTEASFRLGKRAVRLHFGGEFNVSNALAAASAARALGVEPDAIVAGLDEAKGIPGRFEAIKGAGGVLAIVDYAHTPAGLEGLLTAVRAERLAARIPENPGVIVVFGCGGERDRGKRPVMGAVASRLADVVVLTTDNPRSEDPETIIEEIRAGMSGPAKLVVEPNRRTAIAGALRAARPGDVVVVAGKGHETTQEFADVTLRFDDREVVRAELEWIGRATRGAGRAGARRANGAAR